jgi:ClpP class serine protease
MSFAEWAGGSPLAMSSDAASRCASILDDPSLLAARPGKPSEVRLLTIRDGIAEVSIRGVISRYESFWTWLMGGVSTESISRAIHSAVDDPAVSGIVLHVDSPGGQGTGIAELAGYIRKACKVKPVVAYIEGAGQSAAYYLASAASEVVVSSAASVGSIGVVVQLDTRSHSGVKTFVSSQSPRKRSDPTTPEGAADVQAWLDSLADVFVDDVAKYRGVSRGKVIEDFGKGGNLVGKDAVAVGMADAVGDFESVVAALRDTGCVVGKRKPGRSVPGPRTDGKGSMNPFSILARLFVRDPDAVSEAFAAETGGVVPFSVSAKPSKSADELRAEIEASVRSEFEAKAEKERAALERRVKFSQGESAAKERIGSLLKAGKLTPSEASGLVPLCVQLVELDLSGPLAVVDGQSRSPVSRVAVFLDAIEARGEHGMIREVVAGDSPGEGLKVLPSAADKDKGEGVDQRVRSLAELTELGRTTIEK